MNHTTRALLLGFALSSAGLRAQDTKRPCVRADASKNDIEFGANPVLSVDADSKVSLVGNGVICHLTETPPAEVSKRLAKDFKKFHAKAGTCLASDLDLFVEKTLFDPATARGLVLVNINEDTDFYTCARAKP